MQDPNQPLFEQVVALLIEGCVAAKNGEIINKHTQNFYKKIAGLLSDETKQQLQKAPEAQATKEKLELELSLQFQRQVFVIHAAMFVEEYERGQSE